MLLLEKLKSKKTLKRLLYVSAIVLLVLFLFISPYIFFVVQHAITGGEALYTYTDMLSDLKGEPVNIIISDSSLSEVIDGLETQGWKEVPTFSANKSTWQFSIENGTTPMSPRYFEERIQEISLEGPNSTIRHRNHARFWELNGSVYGTLSYDIDIIFFLDKGIPTPTHRIYQNIDLARDVVGDAIASQLGMTISYKDNIFPQLYKGNNAGAWYYTDGETIFLAKEPEQASQKGLLFVRRIYFKIIGAVLNLF